MQWQITSSRLNYRNLFEGWELAIAKAIVGEFCRGKGPFRTEEFDDLLQEVLTHWFFQRDTHDPTREASVRTYMRVVIRNKLIELQQTRKRDKRKTLDKAESLEEPEGGSEEGLSLGETVKAADARSAKLIELKIDLSCALGQLTNRQRAIAELKAGGFTNVEISNKLDVHRDTVQSELRRIRRLFTDAGLRDYLR